MISPRLSELMHESDSQPPDASTLLDAQLQTLAEQMFQRPRTLQELPLILVSPALLNLPQDRWQSMPTIQSKIQTWLEQARLEDERLRIERRLIPYTPIYIPDTPQGQQFLQLAKAIADIPLTSQIVPKNQNQGYWFKTLHYYWQAKGVILAQQILGVIANPCGEDGVLNDRLSDRNLEYLGLNSQTESALFHLLKQGEPYLQQWATQKQVAYSFQSPCELWLEVLREDFLVTWQLGPGNSEQNVLSKAQQRDQHAVQVRLLKQSPWLEKDTGNRPAYDITEQEYRQYLRQAGWSGYWILVLRPQQYDPQIEPLWNAYVQAFSVGKEQTVVTLDWRKGQPFHRPISKVHRPIEATLNLLGYIQWTQT